MVETLCASVSSPRCNIGVLIIYKIARASASYLWLQSVSPREEEKPLMAGPNPRDSDFFVLGCSLDIGTFKNFKKFSWRF